MKNTRTLKVDFGYSLKIMLALFFTMAAAGSLYAQDLDFNADDLKFSDFDKDDNGKIQLEEFEEVFTWNYWEDWDSNDDAKLDDEDFYTASYDLIDENDDDFLTEDEWGYGYDYMYGDYLDDDFGTYDLDDDGFIDSDEYYESFSDSDYYVDWDFNSDTGVNEQELARNVFNTWDKDGNGTLSKSEYNNFDDAFADL